MEPTAAGFRAWRNDDLPILASQRPVNVDDADVDKLLPGDATLIEYRKIRQRLRDELSGAHRI